MSFPPYHHLRPSRTEHKEELDTTLSRVFTYDVRAASRHKHEGHQVVPEDGKEGVDHPEDVPGAAHQHLHTH